LYKNIHSARVITEANTKVIESTKDFMIKSRIKNHDTVLSIGAETGEKEFIISMFTDSILFYLEDINTSRISQNNIEIVYTPYYSKMRGSPITNKFVTVKGTPKTIPMSDNSVNKIIIYKAYHHFKHDTDMMNECYRILRKNGIMTIGEHVLKKNKKSRKFCTGGGWYKTEENFVKDIEKTGFKSDTIYSSDEYWRIFVFSK
jgi:ubiquinone/menaquinone biosynthesis C-methylase UbiE